MLVSEIYGNRRVLLLLQEKEVRVLHQIRYKLRDYYEETPQEFAQGTNVLCISQHDTTKIMDEVHANVCRPHTNSMTLSKKTLSCGY